MKKFKTRPHDADNFRYPVDYLVIDKLLNKTFGDLCQIILHYEDYETKTPDDLLKENEKNRNDFLNKPDPSQYDRLINGCNTLEILYSVKKNNVKKYRKDLREEQRKENPDIEKIKTLKAQIKYHGEQAQSEWGWIPALNSAYIDMEDYEKVKAISNNWLFSKPDKGNYFYVKTNCEGEVSLHSLIMNSDIKEPNANNLIHHMNEDVRLNSKKNLLEIEKTKHNAVHAILDKIKPSLTEDFELERSCKYNEDYKTRIIHHTLVTKIIDNMPPESFNNNESKLNAYIKGLATYFKNRDAEAYQNYIIESCPQWIKQIIEI